MNALANDIISLHHTKRETMKKLLLGLTLGISVTSATGYMMLSDMREAEFNKGMTKGITEGTLKGTLNGITKGKLAGMAKGRDLATAQFRRGIAAVAAKPEQGEPDKKQKAAGKPMLAMAKKQKAIGKQRTALAMAKKHKATGKQIRTEQAMAVK